MTCFYSVSMLALLFSLNVASGAVDQQQLIMTCDLDLLIGPLQGMGWALTDTEMPIPLSGIRGSACGVDQCSVGDAAMFKCSGDYPRYGYVHTICTHEGWSIFNRLCTDGNDASDAGFYGGLAVFIFTVLSTVLLIIVTVLSLRRDTFDAELVNTNQSSRTKVTIKRRSKHKHVVVEEESKETLPKKVKLQHFPRLLNRSTEKANVPVSGKMDGSSSSLLPQISNHNDTRQRKMYTEATVSGFDARGTQQVIHHPVSSQQNSDMEQHRHPSRPKNQSLAPLTSKLPSVHNDKSKINAKRKRSSNPSIIVLSAYSYDVEEKVCEHPYKLPKI